ncbi:MAG: cytochrome c oxidase assembly protein [Parvibaculaceae bacterium]|nr:cytochrome c oxidase assembly protein [Parvibaculaceae bacterium]
MILLRSRFGSIALSAFLIGITTAGVVYSPTLYRMFCNATGSNGTVRRVKSVEGTAIGDPITVRFDTNVAPGLDWDFEPEQPQVHTRLGLPTTVFFRATNRSDKTVVAQATYNVTPEAAGYYFTKTQCFCFSSEKLAPGESARMPVVFYVDPQLRKDVESASIHTITLSYTFFPQPTDESTVASARSLEKVSQTEQTKLKTEDSAAFSGEVQHPR